ncbi:MAG TPA: GNAT family N-acetyltransferase, partial [Planctomycetaceae bacterium]|nr:GNAT family N-acetyltransferase [Planctomycetaceae bacterium]
GGGAFERSIESNRVAPEAIRGEYIDHLLAECAKSDGYFLVAQRSDQVVGFICVLCRVESEDIVEREREYAYVTDLVVVERHRNTGIGADLMRAAETRARSRGATRIRVGVLAANSGAHRLYHQLGYSAQEVVLEKRIGARHEPG